MEAPKKIYNLQYLTHFAGLDTRAGIDECGSRRSYFDELDKFCEAAPASAAQLDERKTARELVSVLGELQSTLLQICDLTVTPKVEDLVLLLEKKSDPTQISDKLFEVQNSVNALAKKIQLAVNTGDGNAAAKAPAGGEAAADAPAAQNAAGEKKLVVPDSGPPRETPGQEGTLADVHAHNAPRFNRSARPEGFAKVKTQIEDFDFNSALHGARTLARFSYNEKIDHFLASLIGLLETSCFKEARTEAGRLLDAAQDAYEAEQAAPRKPVILAIDDMPDVLTAIKAMLRNDYVVYCVTNGGSALKFLADNTPDLILLDMEMPGMNGLELARIIRQMSSCKDVPVIFLSGNANVESVKQSIEAGGDTFIKKPVDYETLSTRLAAYINKRPR